jgi:hypothetical protein
VFDGFLSTTYLTFDEFCWYCCSEVIISIIAGQIVMTSLGRKRPGKIFFQFRNFSNRVEVWSSVLRNFFLIGCINKTIY